MALVRLEVYRTDLGRDFTHIHTKYLLLIYIALILYLSHLGGAVLADGRVAEVGLEVVHGEAEVAVVACKNNQRVKGALCA